MQLPTLLVAGDPPLPINNNIKTAALCYQPSLTTYALHSAVHWPGEAAACAMVIRSLTYTHERHESASISQVNLYNF